jgi:hypothetical protein
VWGYSSDAAKDIPVADPNNIVFVAGIPKPTEFHEQPTTFKPGYHRFLFVTKVPFFLGGGPARYIDWKLDGKTVRADIGENPYQCTSARFQFLVAGGQASAVGAIRTLIADDLVISESRVTVIATLQASGIMKFEVTFKIDPDFDYAYDFEHPPQPTPELEKFPPEREPDHPIELLVKLSQMVQVDPSLLIKYTSAGGGSYVQSYTNMNPNLRLQEDGIDLPVRIFPKDPMSMPLGHLPTTTGPTTTSTGPTSSGPGPGPRSPRSPGDAAILALSSSILLSAFIAFIVVGTGRPF